MSRESRYDKLESGIVDALRRAPGAEPSADLDARILARAHAAVAKPTRRPQPVWFSMAAGLVVLVGSGLALRIWQQVEHAPTALDAPPAASAPAQSREAESTAATAAPDSGAGAPPERVMNSHSEAAAAARDASIAAQAGADLRREKIAEESKLDALDLSAGPDTAENVMPTVAPAPKPFPAKPREPEPLATPADQPAMSPSTEVMRAPQQSTLPAAPPPASAPPPVSMMQAAPVESGATQSGAAAKAESAKARAVEDLVAPGRDADAFDQPELDGLSERQRAAPFDDQPIDTFATALARVRQAMETGDLGLARRLATELHRDHPDRELPEDVRRLVDRPR